MFAAAPTIPFSSPHRLVAEQVVTGPPDGVANEFQLTIGSEAMEKCGGQRYNLAPLHQNLGAAP